MAQEGKGGKANHVHGKAGEGGENYERIRIDYHRVEGCGVQILTTTDRINLIAGHAGSGKTYAMDAVNASIVAHSSGI